MIILIPIKIIRDEFIEKCGKVVYVIFVQPLSIFSIIGFYCKLMLKIKIIQAGLAVSKNDIIEELKIFFFIPN